MTGFADAIAASRRLFTLRLLVETGGQLNESVIYSTASRAGVGSVTRDDIRQDLDRLRALGCVTEEWLEHLRVVTITERGEDAAHGRVAVDGVEHSRWRR